MNDIDIDALRREDRIQNVPQLSLDEPTANIMNTNVKFNEIDRDFNPYYNDGDVMIINADCRDVLPELPSIDLILTDPPYGIGAKYNHYEDTRENTIELANETVPMMREIGERVVITCGVHMITYYPKADWVLCWYYKGGSNACPWGFNTWQPILVYGPDPFLKNRLGSRADTIDRSGTPPQVGHPCKKPTMFWKLLFARSSVLQSDLVLDPFMGAGSTLIASKQAGRKVIGIEIDQEYCDIAINRIRQGELGL